MPDRDSDLHSMDDLRRLRLHELITRYARHREDGDEAAMHAAWEAICLATYDRLVGMVKSFHFPGGERLPHHRVDDAVQEAYLEVAKQALKFRGGSEGEFFAALGQWAWNACMNLGRSEFRHQKRHGGSLDQSAFEGEDSGDRHRFDDALEREAGRRDAEREAKEDAEVEITEQRDLVAWAIAQIDNENYRVVLEMTLLQGLEAPDIAAELGITMDNVYARRSRGMKRLGEILRDLRD